ncbi:nucleoside recognition domain-containing protein [[Clostridium] cellulosi]
MPQFGVYAVPIAILGIVLCGIIKKQNIFDLFLNGAKEGITVAFNILPALVGLMMAVEMFKASGAMDFIVSTFAPIGKALNFPSEVIPLAIMRPISGSGSLTVFESLLKTYGPDSFIGRVASVMQGSTETTFYTVAVYYGSVGVTKTRHTLPAALSADFIGFIMSIISVKLILGG